MDTGQRALLALEVETAYAEVAKQRQAEAAERQNAAVTAVRRGRAGLSDLDNGTVTPVPADRPEPADRRMRESRERAAQALGTSGRAVQRAKALVRDAPDLADQVRTGKLALAGSTGD